MRLRRWSDGPRLAGARHRDTESIWVFLCASVSLWLVISLAAVGQGAAPSVWDGVYTDEQAKRGEAVYYSRCAACHGPEMEGGDMTPPLTGGGFTATWSGLSVADLFERIRITMPMSSPGSLSRQQNADVIAFILKSNRWPAGAAELPRELAALKEIQIEALKP